MGKLFALSGISFICLFSLNLVWVIIIITSTFSGGIQTILQGERLTDVILFSVYTKWILLSDIIWICAFTIFILSRKQYKTDAELHYLTHRPLDEIRISVVIPAYNEENSIEEVIRDFQKQKFVKNIIVIDNHSSDNTVSISKKLGATVIEKNENKGYAHSVLLGFKESLKTDANAILFTESDGTYNGYDIEKLSSYLINADMVLGSRYTQVLSEEGNQNSIMHIWGNIFLAKLIQIKYFSLKHLGAANLTDVGCGMRLVRRNCLEDIIPYLSKNNSEHPIASDAIQIHMTMLTIERNFRFIEVPITFNKRNGKSKLRSDEFFRGIHWGLKFLWFIMIN